MKKTKFITPTVPLHNNAEGQNIFVNILNNENEIVERMSVSDELSFAALERICEGHGYTVERL